jgi:hypothetical protein
LARGRHARTPPADALWKAAHHIAANIAKRLYQQGSNGIIVNVNTLSVHAPNGKTKNLLRRAEMVNSLQRITVGLARGRLLIGNV